MKELTIQDFEKMPLGNWDFYFIHRTSFFEIILQPCQDGYDVLVLDFAQNLIKPKFCTHSKGSFYDKRFRAVFEAIRMANIYYFEIYEKYLRVESEQLRSSI